MPKLMYWQRRGFCIFTIQIFFFRNTWFRNCISFSKTFVLHGGFQQEVLLCAEIDRSNAAFNQMWAMKCLSRKWWILIVNSVISYMGVPFILFVAYYQRFTLRTVHEFIIDFDILYMFWLLIRSTCVKDWTFMIFPYLSVCLPTCQPACIPTYLPPYLLVYPCIY
jgi:hypothetical protein